MRHCLIFLSVPFLSAALVAVPQAVPGQIAVTAADYARAERFLAASTTPLVDGLVAELSWSGDGRLTYRRSVKGGQVFLLVDPAAKTRRLAFDHARLAAAINARLGGKHPLLDLPLSRLEFAADGQALRFDLAGKIYSCSLSSYALQELRSRRLPDLRNAVLSPDGKRAAFLRDHNLWLRELATGKDTQLTRDGVEDFGYATNNAGWVKRDGPVLTWSPDSTKIATFQHDGRKVKEMYLVSTAVGHPELEAWKYPLPGDQHIFMIHRVVIHLDGPRVVRMKMPPDAHRSTTTDHVAGRDGRFLDVEWSQDGKELAFVSSSRDHREARLRPTDPETGSIREVLEEEVPTYFESGTRQANWRVLNESNELIWFSERSNWGHLYRYDLTTGKLLGAITAGDWAVQRVLRVDRQTRLIYFTAAGREPGDPYFQFLYSVGLDGQGLKLLTPEPANHAVTLAPGGGFFVDSHSTPTQPPTTVLRRLDGSLVMQLERGDVSRLVAAGWRPPEPFTVKARDAKTDLFGLLYRPSNFDGKRRYPVLNYLYPGPQSGSVGSRSFRASRSDKQALAELGFIVVEVDAMGTPGRSKSFHDAYYGNMGDNGLPDQVTAIKQLGRRHPWMDLTRVGIWGHSGGGFASTGGILRYPKFYKVAVSSAGNHDNRNYEDDWGEKWHGMLTRRGERTNYDSQANQLLASKLEGKLLLAHGTMDSNVPPSNTMLVVNALIKANKDFDLLLLPNRGHGFGSEPYMMRRRWDYFVRHLHGITPPKEYRFKTDTRRRR